MASTDFDTSNTDRVTVPLYAEITGLSTLTVCAWTRRANSGGNALGRILAMGDNAGLEWAVFHEIVSSVSRLRFSANRWGTNTGVWRAWTSWATNGIHHIAVSYDYGSTANDPVMYKDGVLETTTETATPSGSLGGSGSGSVWIGNTSALNRNWGGQIWELGLWNRILTVGEIRTAMHAGPMRVRNGLVMYLPLIDGTTAANYAHTQQGTLTGPNYSEHGGGRAIWGIDEGVLRGGVVVGGGGTGARSFVAGMIG